MKLLRKLVGRLGDGSSCRSFRFILVKGWRMAVDVIEAVKLNPSESSKQG
jgi:hypothetical protein